MKHTLTATMETCMKFMKHLVFLAALLCVAAAAHAEPVKISVSQFVEHPALDAVLKGFQDDLKENNIQAEYQIYNAQGSMPTTTQIAQQMSDDGANMLIAIATPNAQACVAMIKKAPHLAEIPLLFTAITDPVAAGLVKDLAKPTANVTGVSNQMPMDKHLAMVKKFIPELKTLGVIYNAGEVNSKSNVKRLKAAAEEMGIEIVEANAPKSSDVTQAAQSLVGKVEAMYVPTDNTVVSNIEAAVKVAEMSQTPLFCADTDSVTRGAVAAMGFDYYLHGKQTGAMARRILSGEKPQDNPVEFQKKLEFHINTAAAKKQGVKVEQKVLDSADKVLK